MFPAYSWVLGFIIGAAAGSFLNMLIWRLPRQLSFWEPSRSYCPKCKHLLSGIDLIPLFSWLSTKGKCRYCAEPVASRYFWVEVLTATLFSAIWWQYCIVGEDYMRCGFYMAATALLVAVIYIDWELYIIPDELNAAIFLVGIAYNGLTNNWNTAIFGALLGWGLLWGITLLGRLAFGKDAMGDGDIKMMRGVGALIGPTLMFANLGIAVVLGIIGGVIGMQIAKRNQPAATEESPSEEEFLPPTPISVVLLSGAWYLLLLDIVSLVVKPLDRWIMSKIPQEQVDQEDNWTPSATTIPFGPYLAAGALVCMLFAHPIETRVKEHFLGPEQPPVAQIDLNR